MKSIAELHAFLKTIPQPFTYQEINIWLKNRGHDKITPVTINILKRAGLIESDRVLWSEKRKKFVTEYVTCPSELNRFSLKN